jgi:hypothetical protein
MNGGFIITRADGKVYSGYGEWSSDPGKAMRFGGEDRAAADYKAGKLRSGGHNVIVEWDEF